MMAADRKPSDAPEEQLSTVELIRRLASRASTLASKEVELARSELSRDVQVELGVLKRAAVAGVAAVVTFNLLLVALIFALADRVMPLATALGLAGVMVLVTLSTALVAWRRHVDRPLARTRRTLRDDVRWAKGELG